MIILGADPGMASFGLALVELGAAGERVHLLEVIRTKKSDRKRGVLAADDNVRRARELAARLLYLVGQHRPRVICAESMSHPRAAGAAGKLSMSWGVLSTIAELLALPVVQASPQAVKTALCGKASASKEDVQRALIDRYGSEVFAGIKRGELEHAADALGAVVACLRSDVVLMARGLAA